MLAIDKPEGWTSHDVVAVVRALVGTRRVGHGGTLDPLATGLLPVLVGTATKFVERLHGAAKVYDALVRFGAETATDDRQGAVTRAAPPPTDLATIEPAFGAFRGRITQTPPDYAAVKVGGRPAYARARAGETLVLAAREVQVYRLEVMAWTAPELRLLIVCSTGTYVRAIARDVGRALASAAHLAALRRLAVGGLEVSAAIGIEDLRLRGADEAIRRLQSPDDRLLALDPRWLEGAPGRLANPGESA